VTLGLCSQIDLDAAVKRAAARLEREQKKANKAAVKAGTLLPTEETIGTAEPAAEAEPEAPQAKDDDMASSLAQEARDAMAAPDEEEEAPDADSVFAKLKDPKPEAEAEAEAESESESKSE